MPTKDKTEDAPVPAPLQYKDELEPAVYAAQDDIKAAEEALKAAREKETAAIRAMNLAPERPTR